MHDCLQPFVAEHADAIGEGERHDDQITGFDSANAGPDSFDDADGLVSHAAARVGVLQRLVRPKITAAYTGAGDGDDSVGWVNETRVRDVFHANVPSAKHNRCAHNY